MEQLTRRVIIESLHKVSFALSSMYRIDLKNLSTSQRQSLYRLTALAISNLPQHPDRNTSEAKNFLLKKAYPEKKFIE